MKTNEDHVYSMGALEKYVKKGFALLRKEVVVEMELFPKLRMAIAKTNLPYQIMNEFAQMLVQYERKEMTLFAVYQAMLIRLAELKGMSKYAARFVGSGSIGS